MMDTLLRLTDFYNKEKYHDGSDYHAKSIVWAHNTYIGDARYSDMAGAKKINIGQLVRGHAGDDKAALVGFGTFQGTVIAAKEWGEKVQRMFIPPAIDGSWDRFIHELSKGHSILLQFDEKSQMNCL
jgi:erythromycin esterase